MTKLREAAEMALETIENGIRVRDCEGGTQYQPDLEEKAIVALRQALAKPDVTFIDEGNKPEQEPEAWMGITDNPYCNDADCNDPNSRAMRWHNKLLSLRKQERTAPPSKPWVYLTKEDIDNVDLPETPTVFQLAQFFENMIKVRNHG